MRVLVTRPAEQAAQWVRDLRAAGLDAESLPLLRIAPPPDGAPLAQAWAELASYDLVFFVSPNAVDRFFASAPSAHDWPAGVLAAAPGPGTANTLHRWGVAGADVESPAADSATFDAAALWSRLSDRDWRDRRVLIVHGEGGRDALGRTLQAAGANVDRIVAYQRTPPLDGPALCARLDAIQAAPADFLWFFSSSAAIANLQAIAPTLLGASSSALATHPNIVAAARRAHIGCVGMCAPTTDAVVAAIIGWPPIQSAPT